MLVAAVLCAACGSPDRLGLHIASTPQWIVAIATAQDRIYARGDTELYEIGPTGGSARLLDALSFSTVLAAAGNQIYFPIATIATGKDGIGAYDRTAAVQRTVVPASGRVDELLADANRIYWVSASSIHAIGADGTGEVLVGSGTGIFQDDQALYWTTGGQIVRAAKADLSSRTTLSPGTLPILSATAYGGNVYWASSNQLLKLPVDGSMSVPTVVGTWPIGPAGTDFVAMRIVAGTAYVEIRDYEPADCATLCFFVARILEINPAGPREIARAEHMFYTPLFAAGESALYWAFRADLYRVH